MKANLIKCISIVSFAFLSACSACDTIRMAKQASNMEHSWTIYNNRPDFVDFDFRGNCILFEAEVNGRNDTVQLDLGFNSTLAYFVAPDERPDVEFVERRIVTTEFSKIKHAIEPVQIGFGNAEIKGFNTLIMQENNPFCPNEPALSYPLLGKGAMQFGSYELNFSEGKIHFCDYYSLDSIDLTGYQEVKSKFSMLGFITIFLTVDGEEYNCIFDTGNSGGLVLKNKKRAQSNKPDDVHYEGAYGRVASGAVKSQKFCYAPNETVMMSGEEFGVDVVYVSNIMESNMGVQFISQFDWVIANGAGKVFFRPRKVERKPFVAKAYSITTTGSQLTILNRCLEKNPKFKVGAVIESVNGEKVTEENICRFYDLLKNVEDWSVFTLVVK